MDKEQQIAWLDWHGHAWVRDPHQGSGQGEAGVWHVGVPCPETAGGGPGLGAAGMERTLPCFTSTLDVLWWLQGLGDSTPASP